MAPAKEATIKNGGKKPPYTLAALKILTVMVWRFERNYIQIGLY
jgi:hypothetical protein